VLLASAALILGACSSSSSSTVRGVVIEVNGDLTTVESFTLRANGGEVIELVPAEDGTFTFPLSHLQEHRASLTPVAVEIEERNGVNVAVWIGDADGTDHRF
jgi:hypothetical protein